MYNYNKPFIKRLFIIILTPIAIISCSMQKRLQISQGAEGHITRLTGNQMPMKGRPQPKGKGIIADVVIYKATSVQQAQGHIPLFTLVNGQPVAQTQSDSTGYYKVALPVGKYSVFVKVGEQFFAAETDGQGTLNPVEVTIRQIAQRNVVVNVGAAY